MLTLSPSVPYGLKELPFQGAPEADQTVKTPTPNYAFTEPRGGIDGEEFMGTGTAFDTSEAQPVYTG